MKHILFLSLFGIFFISCAHHKDVRPGADGINTVTVKAKTKEEGMRNAVSQSTAFCKKRGQQVGIVNESQDYTGDVTEETYKSSKLIIDVAKDIGGIVGESADIGSTTLGDGYTVEVNFKCL